MTNPWITDHEFVGVDDDKCLWAAVREIVHGVRVREPCLKPRDEHGH